VSTSRFASTRAGAGASLTRWLSLSMQLVQQQNAWIYSVP